ncbi:MAG: phosphoribosylformylglycinamidine synthase subunit PurQ [Verrucomicrobia bacterium]|nr:phosphoribosylformylglycinamidine synthase subunit PurQ [Verrucomicrobiota bacterium]MBV8378191.1 phosphoribosylformylglycinamidine synthase subunit PurQ [Verrucomicrobiota bacterium]
MKIAVVQFPGSNCDQDCLRALTDGLHLPAEYVWHKQTSLSGFDAVVLPGGFSYGDYLRCGAIARFSPIMRAVVRSAKEGMPVIGLCNGFQILCEAGLLPGALIRNQSLRFVCQSIWLRVETGDTPFTANLQGRRVLKMPIAHGEGSYFVDERSLETLESKNQVVFRYVDETGDVTAGSNPNGSIHNIAGICNEARNVLGMMPHPDRAWDRKLGSEDGKLIFGSLAETLEPVVSR